MPTGLPGDPQDDGFIKPNRGGGGQPGTTFGAGGGFGGSPAGSGGGGGFNGYSAYTGQPGGSWARKLRYGQPAPMAPNGLSTNPTMSGGPFLPTGAGDGNYIGYNPFPGMGALPGAGGGGVGGSGGASGGNGWWSDWASGPDTQPGNSGPEMGDIARWLVANGGQAGIFDPMGSQGLLQMMQQKAYSEAGAREAGAANAAGMAYGDDPQMAAFARLQARLGSQHDLATSLSGARQTSALQNQQYLQQLASAMYQQWAQYMAQKTGAKLAK